MEQIQWLKNLALELVIDCLISESDYEQFLLKLTELQNELEYNNS